MLQAVSIHCIITELNVLSKERRREPITGMSHQNHFTWDILPTNDIKNNNEHNGFEQK